MEIFLYIINDEIFWRQLKFCSSLSRRNLDKLIPYIGTLQYIQRIVIKTVLYNWYFPCTNIVLFDSLLAIKHWIVCNVTYYDMRLYELCRYEYEITDFYKKSCAFEFYYRYFWTWKCWLVPIDWFYFAQNVRK